MTSSYITDNFGAQQPPVSLPNPSESNYAVVDADQAGAQNEAIQADIEDAREYFKQAIDISNRFHEMEDQVPDSLWKLTKAGTDLANQVIKFKRSIDAYNEASDYFQPEDLGAFEFNEHLAQEELRKLNKDNAEVQSDAKKRGIQLINSGKKYNDQNAIEAGQLLLTLDSDNNKTSLDMQMDLGNLELWLNTLNAPENGLRVLLPSKFDIDGVPQIITSQNLFAYGMEGYDYYQRHVYGTVLSKFARPDGSIPWKVKREIVPYLLRHMAEKRKEVIKDKDKAIDDAIQADRAESLLAQISAQENNKPGAADVLNTWVNTYAGQFADGKGGARREAANILSDGIKSETISMSSAKTLLESYPEGPFQSAKNPKTFRQLFPDEAAIINKAVQAKQRADNSLNLAVAKEEVDNYVDALKDSDCWFQVECMQNAQKNNVALATNRINGSLYLNSDFSSQLYKLETANDEETMRKVRLGKVITQAEYDLLKNADNRGIAKPFIQGGLTPDDEDLYFGANGIITGEVQNYVRLDQGKLRNPALARIIQENAEANFREIYRRLMEQGGEERPDALKTAYEQTKDLIESGSFNTLEGTYIGNDDTRQTYLKEVINNLDNDENYFYSPEPWPGEELILKTAIRNELTGAGSVSNYYKTIARRQKHINGKKLQQIRLKSVGLVKDKDLVPLPEEDLSDSHRDLLLNGVSSSRTYRTALESEDVNWMVKALNNEQIPDAKTLIDLLRQKASEKNSYSGADVNWLRLVQIEEADLEEYYNLVGEVPPYLRLENLTPGIALQILEDTLIVDN
tara:strand:- start:341 stop:2737 length:2397 start_codon:yes stop_codon:yes gene_type:complete